MNPDTRAAAEASAVTAVQVLSTPIRGEPAMRVCNGENAVRLLTAAFLTIWEAAYPADSDEPVDEPTYRKHGAVRVGPIWKWPIVTVNPTVHASVAIDDSGNTAIRVVQDVPSTEIARVTSFVPLGRITTRGQLRNLLAALGIDIKEGE